MHKIRFHMVHEASTISVSIQGPANTVLNTTRCKVFRFYFPYFFESNTVALRITVFIELIFLDYSLCKGACDVEYLFIVDLKYYLCILQQIQSAQHVAQLLLQKFLSFHLSLKYPDLLLQHQQLFLLHKESKKSAK